MNPKREKKKRKRRSGAPISSTEIKTNFDIVIQNFRNIGNIHFFPRPFLINSSRKYSPFFWSLTAFFIFRFTKERLPRHLAKKHEQNGMEVLALMINKLLCSSWTRFRSKTCKIYSNFYRSTGGKRLDSAYHLGKPHRTKPRFNTLCVSKSCKSTEENERWK